MRIATFTAAAAAPRLASMSPPASKHLVLNAFNMNSVGHINHGLWTHPRDRSSEYHTLAYWTELAKTLERGLFDALFLADIVGTYDTYGGDLDLTLRESIQLPINDPQLIVSAMAAATRHLGFGVTVNLTYEQPYLLARRFSTLDHLTDGRVGWNVVTGYLDSAARAMGLKTQVPHDERYDRADEFLEVAYRLWEGSWDDDAVRRDRSGRVFADPAKVRAVRHHGRWFDVEGVHLCEPSRQRTPVLFQAGSSGRGQRFAARHAECVFINGPTKDAVRETVRTLREQVVAAGRRADDVKVLLGVTAIPGRTEAEARDTFEDYHRHASPEAGLAHFAASTGIDFSRHGLDDPIPYERFTNGIESASRTAQQQGWTKRRLFELYQLGGRYPPIVGTGAQVAEALIAWADETGVDGFNVTRSVVPESFEAFADLVVPELQARGRFKTAYPDGTLRRRLFGEGDRLPARHAAAGFRTTPVSNLA